IGAQVRQKTDDQHRNAVVADGPFAERPKATALLLEIGVEGGLPSHALESPRRSVVRTDGRPRGRRATHEVGHGHEEPKEVLGHRRWLVLEVGLFFKPVYRATSAFWQCTRAESFQPGSTPRNCVCPRPARTRTGPPAHVVDQATRNHRTGDDAQAPSLLLE